MIFSADFTPVASAAGGALIGVSAVLLLLTSGKVAGIAGILRRAMFPGATSRPIEAFAFLAGLAATPLLWLALAGQPLAQSMSPNLLLMAVAGLLVGFGSSMGNGCTSGHGVCGLSRFSIRSLAATATFMATAAVTVYIARHVLGA
jgi:uncharacterized protein